MESDDETEQRTESILERRVRQLRHLLEDATEYKTIAQSVSADQVLGRTTIPMGCIKKIRKIR